MCLSKEYVVSERRNARAVNQKVCERANGRKCNEEHHKQPRQLHDVCVLRLSNHLVEQNRHHASWQEKQWMHQRLIRNWVKSLRKVEESSKSKRIDLHRDKCFFYSIILFLIHYGIYLLFLTVWKFLKIDYKWFFYVIDDPIIFNCLLYC